MALLKRFRLSHWSIGTQTFWVMLGVSLLLVWMGATQLSRLLHQVQLEHIREDVDQRTALFSTTLLDALLSEDIPILETSLKGLAEIHENLIGAEFCNYQNSPLIRWGSDIPSCAQLESLQQVTEMQQRQQILTSYREILFEGERFGAIALRWDMGRPYHQLEQQIREIIGLLVVAVLLLALVLFVLVRYMVVRPIRSVDHYLRQVESSEQTIQNAASFNSRELIHLCEGVMALLQSMAAEARLREEREELLATLEEKVVERTRDLKHSNDQLSSIMENMGDALFVLDEERQILVSNPAAAQLFHRLNGVEGFDAGFEALFPADLNPLLERVLSSAQFKAERLLFSDHNEEKVLLELTCSPLPIDTRQTHRLILLRDATERHDQEEREQMLAFHSGAAEVSASMMHHIGNQLSGMNGKLHQLKSAQQMVGKTGEFLQQLAAQVAEMPHEKSKMVLERSAQMLHDMVQNHFQSPLRELESTISKIAETIRQQEKRSPSLRQLSRFHPRSFFRESAALRQHELLHNAIDLQLEVAAGLNEIYLPRNELQLTFLALLDNAIEAIKESGRKDGVITIRCALAQHQAQPGFLLEIEDNGVGLEEEQPIDTLFLAGYSSKGRAGNGLHSSGNFIKSLGGRIHLRSHGRGRGTIVEMWLPEQGTLPPATD